jgi:drug/metabolite transporter (DMT)-like permease
MKSGGKSSIICPLTALYPLVVVLLVPFILHESITLVQAGGILCALIAVALLSTEPQQEAPRDTSGRTGDFEREII